MEVGGVLFRVTQVKYPKDLGSCQMVPTYQVLKHQEPPQSHAMGPFPHFDEDVGDDDDDGDSFCFWADGKLLPACLLS